MTMGVVGADDTRTLESVILAMKDNLITPVLYGDKGAIETYWRQFAPEFALPEVINLKDRVYAAETAAEDACKGILDCLFKGHLETADFMRAIIKRKEKLLISPLLSSIAFFETPAYHKVFSVTDPAVNLYPDIAQKEAIIKNAVRAFQALGVKRPKAAVLAAIDFVNPKMPECVDAEKLSKRCTAGCFGNAVVEGPMPFDLIFSREAAQIKHYHGEVAGDADIILAPDIVSANALTKSLTYVGRAKNGGIVMGASIPVIITSRASPSLDKYHSVLFAAAISAGKNRVSEIKG